MKSVKKKNNIVIEERKNMKKIITEQTIETFREELVNDEKGIATIQKYLRDLKKLENFLKGAEVTKEKMLAYKKMLWDCGEYKISSINSFLVAANRFFKYMGWYENVVTIYQVQKEIFRSDEKVLTEEEYRKLIEIAEKEGKRNLSMMMQTLGNTGLRISELKFITVEAVKQGEVVIYNKGKIRTVLFSNEIRKVLEEYIKEKKIVSGAIFLSRKGNPVDRSNISKQLKALAERAGVDKKKVYPHNFRHLFAHCFYRVCNDIIKVAALLGHSDIKTTMNYLKTTKQECREMLDQIRMVC